MRTKKKLGWVKSSISININSEYKKSNDKLNVKRRGRIFVKITFYKTLKLIVQWFWKYINPSIICIRHKYGDNIFIF